jgi:hypothetical protein
MKKEIKKGKTSAGKIMAVGAGVFALGAGAYYFLGPNGKKNQKKAKIWMVKMEKEAREKIAKIKNASEPVYYKTIDTLAKTYSQQYKEHAPEIASFAEYLKSSWKNMEKKRKPATRKTKKTKK